MHLPHALLFSLLAATAPSALLAQTAQPEPPAAEDGYDEESTEVEELVVTATRPRGEVVGDIAPEITLNPGDIRAYGASSVAELLEQLAPQIQSGRGRGEGGQPVVLLNGRRISGFREVRDLPPEAIERVEILPEEVALKYGYRADQRVVNIVLRERFRARTAEVALGAPTDGGRGEVQLEGNQLSINGDRRWIVDAEYQRGTALLESERDVIQAEGRPADAGQFRTLIPDTESFTANGVLSRPLGDVAASANAEVALTESDALVGRRDAAPVAPRRRSDNQTAGLGVALNGQLGEAWRWAFTGNGDLGQSETTTDREGSAVADRSESTDGTANAELLFSGPAFEAPAGPLFTTFKLQGETRRFESETVRSGLTTETSLSRQRGEVAANVDLPLTSRRREVLAGIGDLSLNGNLEVETLSDFGTLRVLGAGVNWSPIEPLDLIASVTDEDGAPSINQLGDPLIATPNVAVFDFTRGETVEITRLSGGNPGLVADNRRVVKLGATYKPFDERELTLSLNYVRERINDPIASFPAVTAEIEAAFPDRFTRDGGGALVQLDARPINYARSDREEVRTGLNWSKRLTPSAAETAALEREREQRRAAREAGGPPGDGPRAGGGQGGSPGGFGGRGGGGRFGGGRPGEGRLQFAIYHTWRLEESILIRDGVPELDLLDGSAADSNGGRSEHEIDVQAGVFKNGLGARLDANWRSGTTVDGGGIAGGTGDLDFSDLTTVNLRLFADLGQRRAWARAQPWLRGARVSLSVDNLFDQRIDVRDAMGATPIGYQPDLLDPEGRTVRISFRKLFLPRFPGRRDGPPSPP